MDGRTYNDSDSTLSLPSPFSEEKSTSQMPINSETLDQIIRDKVKLKSLFKELKKNSEWVQAKPQLAKELVTKALDPHNPSINKNLKKIFEVCNHNEAFRKLFLTLLSTQENFLLRYLVSKNLEKNDRLNKTNASLSEKCVKVFVQDRNLDVTALFEKVQVPPQETLEILFSALENGNDRIASILLNRSFPKANEKYHNEQTILNKILILVESLDPETKNNKELTKMMEALYRHPNFSEMVTIKNNANESPLQFVFTKQLDNRIAVALLEQGANQNEKADPRTGNTLLHDAQTEKQAQILLAFGADRHALNNKGEEALSLVRKKFPNLLSPSEFAQINYRLQTNTLASLLGDAFIEDMRDETGKKIEGNSLEESMTLIIKLLEDSMQNESEIPAALANRLKEINVSMRQSLNLNELSSDKLAPSVLNRKVLDLKTHETLLLHSGWMGSGGEQGHAALCEIKKVGENNYTLSLINTGGGAGVHTKVTYPDRIKIDPCYVYKGLSLSDLTQTHFFNSLLEVKTTSSSDITMSDRLYPIFNNRFKEHLDKDIAKDINDFVGAQRAGTCNSRCVLAYLRAKLGKEDYKVIKHLISFIAGEKTLELHKEDLPRNKLLREIIERISHNLARQIQKLIEQPNPSISLSKAKEFYQRAAKIHAKIEQYNKEDNIGPKFEVPANIDKAINTESIRSSLNKALSSIEKAEDIKSAEEYKFKDFTPYPLPPVQFDGSLEKLHKLSEFYANNAEFPHSRMISLLTQNVFSLPPLKTHEKDLWSSMSEPQIIQALGDVKILLQTLAINLHTDNVAFCNRMVALNKLMAIAWRLSCRLDDMQYPEKPMQSKLSYYGLDISHLIFLKQNPHNVPQSPEVEKELDNLIDFFKSAHPSPGDNSRTLFSFKEWPTKENSLQMPPPAENGDFFIAKAIWNAAPEQYKKDVKARFEKGPESSQIKGEDWEYACAWCAPPGNQKLFCDMRDLAICCSAVMYADAKALDEFGVKRASRKPWEKSPADKSFKGDVKESLFAMGSLKSMKTGGKPLLIAKVQTAVTPEAHIDLANKPRITTDEDGFEKEVKKETTHHDAHTGLNNEIISTRNGKKSFEIYFDTMFNRVNAEHYPENAYIAKEEFARPFFDISNESNLSVHRLIQYYNDHISKLRSDTQRVYFYLTLFGKGHLTESLKSNPESIHPLLNFLDKSITEFELAISSSSQNNTKNREDLIYGLLHMKFIKLQALNYSYQLLPKELSEKLLKTEREKLKSWESNNSLIPEIKDIVEFREMAGYLMMMTYAHEKEWSNPETMIDFLVANTKPRSYARMKMGSYAHTYPEVISVTDNILASQINRFSEVLADRNLRKQVCNQAFKAAGIDIPLDSEWKGTFPFYEVKTGATLFQIDLLQGCLYQDGKLLHQIKPQQILKNSSNYESIFGNENLKNVTLLPIKDGLWECTAESGGSKYRFVIIKEGITTTRIANVQKNIDGLFYDLAIKCQLADSNAPNGLSLLPLPNKPYAENYELWVSREHDKQLIIFDKKTHERVLTVLKNGEFLLEQKDLPESFRQIPWQKVEIEKMEQFNVLRQFESPDNILCVQGNSPLKEEKSGIKPILLNFSRYLNPDGKTLEFHGPKLINNQMRLVWKDNPAFFISPDQTIPGLSNFSNRLVLEDKKGNKKVIFPIKTVNDIKGQRAADQPNTYSYQVVDINDKGLSPKGEKQNLLMAYYYLSEKRYDMALGFLKKARKLDAYTPDELKILGWIALQGAETHLNTPEDKSLRLFAFFLVNENSKRHPVNDEFSKEELEEAKKAKEPPGLYSSGRQWKKWWMACGNEKTKKPYIGYLKVLKNIPKHLQILPSFKKEGRGIVEESSLISRYEESAWLDNLQSEKKILQLSAREAYINTLEFTPQILPPTSPTQERKGKEDTPFYNLRIMPGKGRYDIATIPDQPLADILASCPRIVGSDTFGSYFGDLYLYAKYGSINEQKQVLNLVNDLRFQPEPKFEVLRALLEMACKKNELIVSKQELEPHLQNVLKAIEDHLSKETGDKRNIADTQFYENFAKVYSALYPSTNNFGLGFGLNMPPKMPLPALSAGKTDVMQLWAKNEPDPLRSNWNQYFRNVEKNIVHSDLKNLPPTITDPYFINRHSQIVSDWERGKSLNDAETKIALQSDESLKQVESDLNQAISAKDLKIKQLEDEIKKLANTMPSSPNAELNARLRILGGEYQPPTLTECIGLFVQQDKDKFRKKLPYLDYAGIESLNNLIGEYLSHSTDRQHYKRAHELALKAINQLEKKTENNKSPGKYPKATDKLDKTIHLLGAELNKKKEYDLNKWPAFAVFEYYANVRLRASQCKDLADTLTKTPDGKFPDIILQRIMAAGKTFVLGTLLALQKADGYHLSVLIPPASLFETNVQDLKVRSEAFFGQKAHTIEFSRAPEHFTMSYLNWIHYTMIKCINDREFLIVPPQTLQCLENKYIETLEKIKNMTDEMNSPLANKAGLQLQLEQIQGPAKELEKILALLKSRGSATFDEVDMTFSPKVELNFPILAKAGLDKPSCDLVGELLYIASTDSEINQSGLDLLNNNQTKFVPGKLEGIKQRLAEVFVKELPQKQNLLLSLGLNLDDFNSIKEGLTHYLWNKDASKPAWLDDLANSTNLNNKLFAERIVLLKQEIQEWLPEAWKRSIDEHFGRSKLKPDEEVAIPFVAANTPKEKSEFADRWETVNKTCHLYLSKGLDLNQTRSLISLLSNQALQEWRDNDGKTPLSEVPTAKTFASIARDANNKPLDLMTIDLEDANVLAHIQNKINDKSKESLKLVLLYIANSILPKIKTHLEQITHNAQNLGSMFSSRQGYSGTIDNKNIFPEGFSEEKQTIRPDLGANGKIIDAIFKRENNVVREIPSSIKSTQALLQLLMGPHETRWELKTAFNSFIDIGAHFKGRTNNQVAKEFYDYFKQEKDSPIKGVLYYDDVRNTLAFIGAGHEDMPVFLPDTSPQTIRSVTGLKPEQLFTYYDQRHTTGSDIPQAPNAKACVTIGETTTLRDILQGILRMRQFFQDQTIEFIIPEEMKKLIESRIGPLEKITAQDIILFGELNSLLQEKEDNKRACLQKMSNCVRSVIMDKLLQIEYPDKKLDLYIKARSLFIRDTVLNLYALYADKPENVPSEKIIEGYKQSLLAIVNSLSSTLFTAEERKNILEALDQIKKTSLPTIEPMLAGKSQYKIPQDTTVENVQEEKSVKETKSEQEQESQNELFAQGEIHLGQKISEYYPWDLSSTDSFKKTISKITMPSPFGNELALHKLNDVLKSNPETILYSHCFDDHIIATSNFLKTMEGQFNLFDENRKNIFEVMIYKDPVSKQSHMMLVSGAEAAAFKEALNKTPPLYSDMCLVEPDGAIIAAGKFPADELNTHQVKNLLLQALFLSGNINKLKSDAWSSLLKEWAKTYRGLKRELFESALLSNISPLDYANSRVYAILNEPEKEKEIFDKDIKLLSNAFLLLHQRNANLIPLIQELSRSLKPDNYDAILLGLDFCSSYPKRLQKPAWLIHFSERLSELITGNFDKWPLSESAKLQKKIKEIASPELINLATQLCSKFPQQTTEMTQMLIDGYLSIIKKKELKLNQSEQFLANLFGLIKRAPNANELRAQLYALLDTTDTFEDFQKPVILPALEKLKNNNDLKDEVENLQRNIFACSGYYWGNSNCDYLVNMSEVGTYAFRKGSGDYFTFVAKDEKDIIKLKIFYKDETFYIQEMGKYPSKSFPELLNTLQEICKNDFKTTLKSPKYRNFSQEFG